MRSRSVHDSCCTTCGFGILAVPISLLTSPSGSAGATDTASTLAVVTGKGHTGGSSGQPSQDDHAGEVGFLAFSL
jgi:hypothetical protein